LFFNKKFIRYKNTFINYFLLTFIKYTMIIFVKYFLYLFFTIFVFFLKILATNCNINFTVLNNNNGYSTIDGSNNNTNNGNPAIADISPLINGYYYYAVPNKSDNSLSIFKIGYDGTPTLIKNYNQPIISNPYMVKYSYDGEYLAVMLQKNILIFKVKQNGKLNFEKNIIIGDSTFLVYLTYFPDSNHKLITLDSKNSTIYEINTKAQIPTQNILNENLNINGLSSIAFSNNPNNLNSYISNNCNQFINNINFSTTPKTRKNYFLNFLSFPTFIKYINKNSYIKNDIICISDAGANSLFTVKVKADGSLESSYLSKFPNSISNINNGIFSYPFITSLSYNSQYILFNNTISAIGGFGNSVFLAQLNKDGTFNNNFVQPNSIKNDNLTRPSCALFLPNTYYSIVDDYKSGLFFIAQYYVNLYYTINCSCPNNKTSLSIKIDDILNNNILPVSSISTTPNPSPLYGSVSIKNNEIIYQPNDNISGLDLFGITLQDQNGYQTKAYINITINPYIPEQTINVLGDNFAISLDNLIATGCGTNLKYVGTTNTNVSYNILYTPKDNFIGTDKFIYSVIDENQNQSSNYVYINVKDN